MAEITSAEYLERLFADSFKREIDQDENVVRSLPFFATSLALVATLLGFAVHALPPVNSGVWSYRSGVLVFVGLLLIGATWAFGSVLWHLFIAIRPRTYVIPPPETELTQWESALRAFHAGAGLAGDDLERAIIADVRALMIAEYAKACTTNRANNLAKMFARTQALSRLITALAFSFAIVVVKFVDGQIASYLASPSGGPSVQSTTSRIAPSDDAPAGADDPGGQASAADEPVHHRGGAPALGEGSADEGQPGAEAMTNNSHSPSGGAPAPSAPAQPSPVQKPPAPASQTFQKSDPSGVLKK